MSVVVQGGGIIIRLLHFIFHPHLSPPPSRGRRIGDALLDQGGVICPPKKIPLPSYMGERERAWVSVFSQEE
jgi:hypothetical protein